MRVLLIVDDEPDLEPLFRAFLGRDFDAIHFVGTAAEGERVLAEHPVTHLVADHTLSNDGVSGIELLARWRAQRASIRFTALFSGSTQAAESTSLPGVDEIYVKPQGFEPLLERLRKD